MLAAGQNTQSVHIDDASCIRQTFFHPNSFDFDCVLHANIQTHTRSKCILSFILCEKRENKDILREDEGRKKKNNKEGDDIWERSKNRSEMRKYIHMKQFPWKYNENKVGTRLFECIQTSNICIYS